MALSPNRRETGRDRSDPQGRSGRVTSAAIDSRQMQVANPDEPAAAPNPRQRNREAAGADYDFMEVARMAEDRDQVFKGAMQRARWQRAIAQLQNKHYSESKYNSTTFRNRSKIFRPKSLSALRKNMAAAAAALFSTNDVVVIRAEYDSDPIKNASAACLQELLNYRLDRTSVKSGIPWFLVSMGAKRNVDTYGVCYSKQFWEYEEVEEETIDTIDEQHVYLDTGEPVLDEETGAPKTSRRQERNKKKYVTKDRPMSTLLAPDNVILDPAAPWEDPCQSSSYLGVRYPMTLDEARTLLANPGKGDEAWLQVDDSVLQQASEEYTSKGVRAARGDGIDRFGSDYRSGEGGKGAGSGIVWLYEWFMRVAGVDYHFWTVGTIAYASQVRTTRQAYPEQRGDRPVVGGYGTIEPHEVYPMSAVHSWAQMQSELNDLVNLRLDNLKQALSPIAKVKQGATFDFKQLQARSGQDVTIQVKSMDDLEFDRPPDVAQSAYQETALLNNDFDDLSGVFGQSSLQSNRQLNETVGGLRLLSGTANAVTEFDLRVWVETWVEKVLRQIVRLEQMWEDDEIVLSTCGQRAKMMERFGVNQITDQDLTHETSVKVNVGLGSADPMQKMTKLAGALQILQGMAPFFNKKVMIKPEEMIKEIMGPAGFNDGTRFFDIQEMDQQGADPKAQAAQMEAQMKDAQLQNDQQIAQMQAQMAAQTEQQRDQTKYQIEVLKQHGELLRTLREGAINLQIAEMDNRSRVAVASMAAAHRSVADNRRASA